MDEAAASRSGRRRPDQQAGDDRNPEQHAQRNAGSGRTDAKGRPDQRRDVRHGDLEWGYAGQFETNAVHYADERAPGEGLGRYPAKLSPISPGFRNLSNQPVRLISGVLR